MKETTNHLFDEYKLLFEKEIIHKVVMELKRENEKYRS